MTKVDWATTTVAAQSCSQVDIANLVPCPRNLQSPSAPPGGVTRRSAPTGHRGGRGAAPSPGGTSPAFPPRPVA
eukprot:CAMPEP_0183446282 /NCGR_PEP_ID=MMETSP0370-20130417/97795_1 /TAXON_ID=268820 /ORGANISM="Peridinium aciculiferum, Strain PAER-2" /LENGTH=73 /DNA_ID=CAMNT_0025636989 /DNA_START=142 /DNA_END=359 /DNA_ORIENTATION=+